MWVVYLFLMSRSYYFIAINFNWLCFSFIHFIWYVDFGCQNRVSRTVYLICRFWVSKIEFFIHFIWYVDFGCQNRVSHGRYCVHALPSSIFDVICTTILQIATPIPKILYLGRWNDNHNPYNKIIQDWAIIPEITFRKAKILWQFLKKESDKMILKFESIDHACSDLWKTYNFGFKGMLML